MAQLIDYTAEWRSLAALLNPINYDKITKLTPELYTNERKPVFEAMRQMWTDTNAITSHELKYYLKRDTPQELVTPQNVNLDVLIKALQDCAIRRQLDTKAKEFEAMSQEDEPDLDRIKQVLEFTPVDTTEDSSILPGIANAMTMLTHKADSNYKFVSTGFSTLDMHLGGEWCRKGLTILGALPGTGKTAFALQSMLRMAKRNGTPSLMINMEMTKERILMRGIADFANVDGDDLAVGNLDNDEKERVEAAANEIAKLPIYIISNGDLNIIRIIGQIKEHVQKGVKVVFIDHLQLIPFSGESRNDALGEITRALRAAAMRYDVSIVLLTQLTKSDGRYVVRGSGEVDSKCDVFMIMLVDAVSDIRRMTFEFSKNRDGKMVPFNLTFNGKYQRFIDKEDQVRY